MTRRILFKVSFETFTSQFSKFAKVCKKTSSLKNVLKHSFYLHMHVHVLFIVYKLYILVVYTLYFKDMWFKLLIELKVRIEPLSPIFTFMYTYALFGFLTLLKWKTFLVPINYLFEKRKKNALTFFTKWQQFFLKSHK